MSKESLYPQLVGCGQGGQICPGSDGTTKSQGKEETGSVDMVDSPRLGWLKLNTDGSSKANGAQAAAGGIIRDAKGQWQGGFVLLISGECCRDCSWPGGGEQISCELGLKI